MATRCPIFRASRLQKLHSEPVLGRRVGLGPVQLGPFLRRTTNLPEQRYLGTRAARLEPSLI